MPAIDQAEGCTFGKIEHGNEFLFLFGHRSYAGEGRIGETETLVKISETVFAQRRWYFRFSRLVIWMFLTVEYLTTTPKTLTEIPTTPPKTVNRNQ
jgi:hypothetical protein